MKSQKTNVVEVSKHEEEGGASSFLRVNLRSLGQAEARPDKARDGEGAKGHAEGVRMRVKEPEERFNTEDTEVRAQRSRRGEKVDAKLVWMQLEDQVVPQLRLSVIERAVYYHLLRHSRLEGKVRYRFSIASLGRGTRLSGGPVREAVRRLADVGALRLVRRSKAGHVVEVRVPEEIRGSRFDEATLPERARQGDRQARPLLPHAARLEEIDFMQTKALRESIHAREGGRCFYCLRRLAPTVRCLDHVVPRAQSGRNSYRNLVSCCLECNSQKGERSAEDFVRWLYRERTLTAAELAGRLRALDALAAGKLRPAVQGLRNPESKEVAR